ncbi:MAG: radical SAM protein [Candidatus Heimdallarchaeota archaeon]
MSTASQLSYYPYIVLKLSPACNLACGYCDSPNFLPSKEFMSIELFSRVLEEFVPYFANQEQKYELQLIFHGGEPLLAGRAFFREVLELESHVDTTNLEISNGIQTNGTLITEDWIEIFKQGQFRVGLSLDGPEVLHDKYRKDKSGKPTFHRVAQSLAMFQEEKLPICLLNVVTDESPRYCKSFFQLLMEWDVSAINFLPFIGYAAHTHIDAYSKYACDFFDLWLDHDTPFDVLTFVDILKQLDDRQGKFCYFTEKCRKYIFIDSLGRIYPCDRDIGDDRYQIGTISPSSFNLADPRPIDLQKTLPSACVECHVKEICSGGCPVLISPETGRDVYCSARKTLIQHIYRRLQEQDLNPDDILQRFDRGDDRGMEWVDTIIQ